MKGIETEIERLIETGLAEDVGPGDWTTVWTVPADRVVTARILAKASGVIAGSEIAQQVFLRLDPSLRIARVLADGAAVQSGAEVMTVYGSARAILTAERLSLNLLQHLSGVATATRAFVDAVAGTGTRILDTRKTTPGLRGLEKMAVVAGGGVNHRFGLFDMVLIKENHIRAAGGITRAVAAVARANVDGLPVEVETTSLEEVREAVRAGVDRILLDNMSLETLREAVELVKSAAAPPETEASGGVSLDRVVEIARTGVDFISVGSITHSAPALDLSLLVDPHG